MGMITFEEFDEAIANVAIDAVFPKRDLYMKPVYLHDNKDKKIGMTYVIMTFGSKKYHIGFIHEQVSSMFTVWNGKMGHIVFDVDERDGCIRYYHEPELYDRDNGLSHSQIETIGDALIKYLTSNKEEKDKSGKHKKCPQSFLEKVTIIKLNPEYFERGTAYLCTPLDYPNQKFIGIFDEGDTKEIHFITPTINGDNRKIITANDASNWKIEKMILPFTEEEIDYMIRCMNLSTSDTVGLVAVFASMDAVKYKEDIIKKLRG